MRAAGRRTLRGKKLGSYVRAHWSLHLSARECGEPRARLTLCVIFACKAERFSRLAVRSQLEDFFGRGDRLSTGGKHTLARVALRAGGIDARAMELLALAYGGEHEARTALAHTLRSAGMQSPPSDPAELIAFIRTFVVPDVERRIGAALAHALFEDVRAAIQNVPDSSSGISRRTVREVCVVDTNTPRRSMVARALIGAGLAVDAVETVKVEDDAPLDAVVAFVSKREELDELLGALSVCEPRCLVVCCDDEELAARAFAASRSAVHVFGTDVLATEIAVCVQHAFD
jgi:hypothetical protein